MTSNDFYKAKKIDGFDRTYEEMVRFWILRILVQLGGYREFIRQYRFSDDDLMRFLDVEYFEDCEDADDFDRIGAYRALQERYHDTRLKKPSISDGSLVTNAQWLTKALGLTETEKKIVMFLALSHEYSELATALDTLGEIGKNRYTRKLATILSVQYKNIDKSLHIDSTLRRSGLVKIASSRDTPASKIIELNEEIANSLFQTTSDPDMLFSGYFAGSPQRKLTSRDFDYLGQEYTIIRDYLKNTLRKNISGVNILIHGKPGTGKTQLSHVLASELRANLHVIGMERSDGDPMSGDERFSIYQLAQSLLAKKKNAILLFDEVEDVFPTRWHWLFGKDRSQEGRKAWINNLLENNPVPAIWLTNTTDHIDPATLRRYDIIYSMPLPPIHYRKRIFHNHLKGIDISQTWVDQVAENTELDPANIQRSIKVLHNIPKQSTEENEKNLDTLIRNTMQGKRSINPVLKRT